MSDAKCGDAMWNDGTCAIRWRAVKMRNVVVEYRVMRNGLTAFDVECVPRCGAMERFGVKCGVMSVYVKCGPM